MSDSIDMEYTELINNIMADKNCHFEFRPLGMLEVHNCLENLSDSKVTGVDNIDNFLLKKAADIIAELSHTLLIVLMLVRSFLISGKLRNYIQYLKIRRKLLMTSIIALLVY